MHLESLETIWLSKKVSLLICGRKSMWSAMNVIRVSDRQEVALINECLHFSGKSDLNLENASSPNYSQNAHRFIKLEAYSWRIVNNSF